MPMVMIKCPKTGKPVPTGISMNKASFEDQTNVMEGNSIGCPHCKQVHTWGKKDAFLQEKEPNSN